MAAELLAELETLAAEHLAEHAFFGRVSLGDRKENEHRRVLRSGIR